MIIILTLILFTVGIIIAGGVTDFIKLKIPNLFPILIVTTFIIAYVINILMGLNAFESLKSHIITASVMFVIMLILFFFKLFGGGDAKIIPAITLWIGISGLPTFLMITSVMGGVLALISIGLRKTTIGQTLLTKLLRLPYMQNGWIASMAKGQNVVPYGIAIAIGAIASFRSVGYLP